MVAPLKLDTTPGPKRKRGRQLGSKAKKKKPGPPTDFDFKLGRQLCDLIRTGWTYETAIAAIGFAPKTWRAWLKKGAKAIREGDCSRENAPFVTFVKNFKKASAEAVGAKESTLYEIIETDPNAIFKWLRIRSPQQWSDPKEIHQKVSGPDGKPLQVAHNHAHVVTTLDQFIAHMDAAGIPEAQRDNILRNMLAQRRKQQEEPLQIEHTEENKG